MTMSGGKTNMRRQAISLGRILGIPIGLDYSWFLIFALLTWTLAVGYFPSEFNNWPTAEYWIVGGVTAVMLFVSVLLHELGHSVLAMHYKIPVRSITLFIFGGIAQIGAEPPGPAAEFWIAIAGPVVSFGLAALFALLQPVFTGVAPLLALAKYLAYINGVLALFNLIPGFPLDGGRVFRAIVWGITHSLHRATVIAANVGRLIGFLFIFLGAWQLFSGNFANGLWIAFIGWFLESAAAREAQYGAVHDMLAGHKVSEVMTRGCASIPADTNLQSLVDDHILGAGRRSLVVTQDSTVVGLLTLHGVKEVPQAEWPASTAAQVMMSMDQIKRVGPDTELWPALEEMDRDGVNQLPVMTNGHCIGMLSRENVIDFLRTRRELGV
jgi:Zn-dependent protease/CBS domain-containing protein